MAEGVFDKNESYSTLSRPMSIYKCPAGEIVDITVCGLVIISNFDSHGDYIFAIWDPDSDIVAYVVHLQWVTMSMRSCDRLYASNTHFRRTYTPCAQLSVYGNFIVDLPKDATEITVFSWDTYNVYVYGLDRNAWVSVMVCSYPERTTLHNTHVCGDINRVQCDRKYVYVSLQDHTLWRVSIDVL